MSKKSKKKSRKQQRKEPSNRVVTTSTRKETVVRKSSPVITAKASKTIFITGASGFVGKAVVAQALLQGYRVIAFIRQSSAKSFHMHHPNLELRYGDVLKYDSLVTAMAGADAIIHLVGIIQEHKGTTFEKMHGEATLRVVDAAKEVGITRFLHMSALGTRPDAKSRYHKSKFKAEEIVQNSGLEYTIFRPSLIYGKDDSSINMFVRILKRQPGMALFPIMGKGKLQPISVEDVARGVVNSLKVKESIGQILPMGGPHSYTLQEIIRLLGEILGKKVFTPHVPYHMSRAVVTLGGPLAPLSKDQLKMLQEDNTCDPMISARLLDVRLREFEPRIREYILLN